jgi:quinol monooxygenase YgiN
MIIIHATLQVNQDKKVEFLQEVQPLIAATRAESGNISYRLLNDTEEENVFTMVEIWEDLQAVSQHNSSEHFTAFIAKAKEFLSAPLTAKIFEGQPINS